MAGLVGTDREATVTQVTTLWRAEQHLRMHITWNLEGDGLCCQVPLLSGRNRKLRLQWTTLDS